MRDKYRRVTSIFVRGTEVELGEQDGEMVLLWVQALNPFEQNDARTAAQAAKFRLTLALDEHGSDELTRYQGFLASMDRAELIDVLTESHSAEILIKVTDEIEGDPDWAETLSLLEQEEELLSRSPTDAERALLDEAGEKYLNEVQERMTREAEDIKRDYEAIEDMDQLTAEFRRVWIERQGGDRALEEYRLKSHFYAARSCDGVKRTDGSYDHSRCDHSVRAWETEEEVRHLPDPLRDKIDEALEGLDMAPKELSASDSPNPSSPSSPPPSMEEAASSASTPAETRNRLRGIS